MQRKESSTSSGVYQAPPSHLIQHSSTTCGSCQSWRDTRESAYADLSGDPRPRDGEGWRNGGAYWSI